jgi:hypothetical protein
MTNIWVVNDEYVSVAGLGGIHLGFVSKGFNIDNFSVEHLTIKQMHEKAEKFYSELKKYPNDMFENRMIINLMPPEIELIIDQINLSLQNSTHDVKMNTPIIEWLENNNERYEYCENSSEIACAINKEAAKYHFLTEDLLRESCELDDNEDISDQIKIEYTRDRIKREYEEGMYDITYLFFSITFATAKSNIILEYTLNTFTNPGDLPNLTWGNFYLNNGDLWMNIHNDLQWITNYYQLTDKEILDLWK